MILEYTSTKYHISYTEISSAQLILKLWHIAIAPEIQKYNQIDLRNLEIQKYFQKYLVRS